MVEPVLLRIQETAKLLKVSKWTVYRWIDEGRLKATKIGRGSLRVFRASVSGLIEETRIDRGNNLKYSPRKMDPARAKGRKRKE